MKIDHIAIWTNDLEKVKDFYTRYFNMKCSEPYVNAARGFSSCFLSFEGAETRIELMHRHEISGVRSHHADTPGLAHVAVSVGDRTRVNELTERLREDGYRIIGAPRTTGDGYYESVVEDCEGNVLEITE